MVQLPQYLLWIGATVVAGYVAALSWRLGVSRRFPLLTTYLILSIVASLARVVVLGWFGFSGDQYMVTYYISDMILTVVVYLVVIELCRSVLPAKHRKILPRYSVAILVLLTVFSYAVTPPLQNQLLIPFAYEFATNLWFVSVGVTLVLWGLIYFRDLPRGMAAHMVQVWGVYFLLMASTYVIFYFFHNLPPSAPRMHLEIPEMAGAWLPLGLGFAILNKSQNDTPFTNGAH
jgi:hypothetical protein